MNCRSVERLLSNYLEGRLSPRVMGTVAEHLLGCQSCRRLRDHIRAAERDLLHWPDPLPPADLERRAVQLRMAQREMARRGGRSGGSLSWPASHPGWRSPLAAAVMVAVLLLAVLGLVLPASGNVSKGASGRFLASRLPGPALRVPLDRGQV